MIRIIAGRIVGVEKFVREVKGDELGHPFRGNQYSGGEGGAGGGGERGRGDGDKAGSRGKPLGEKDTVKPGEMLVFHDPIEEEGEVEAVLRVVEDRGDRVLVQDTRFDNEMIRPTRSIMKGDLTRQSGSAAKPKDTERVSVWDSMPPKDRARAQLRDREDAAESARRSGWTKR